MQFNVSISGKVYTQLQKHLFPGDGNEAVAIALCGRHSFGDQERLLFHKLIPIPYDQCKIRRPDFIKWSTDSLTPYLTEAAKRGWGVVKIHSHPTGYRDFSETDDASDKDLFNSVYGWMNDDEPHGSMVMLPDGRMFGRVILPDLSFEPFAKISIVGDDLKYWFTENGNPTLEEFSLRTSQAFGLGTTSLLKKLKIGIVGCSGTGSPTIEQLTRLGVGRLVLVDPDKIEEKNLNRILGALKQNATNEDSKVNFFKNYIQKIGIGTQVENFDDNIYDNIDAIKCLASCDAIFGCVDSIDGRHLLNQIASFYLIPYFDLGVKIIADGKGGITQICGAVHYIQPGGSSLKTRGVYTVEELRATAMFRSNPEAYEEQRKSGYIVNVNVESPAVISINMFASSMGVNEFLARIHPFRYDPNNEFAITRFSISDSYVQREVDDDSDEYLNKYVGRGDMLPLLNMPDLS